MSEAVARGFEAPRSVEAAVALLAKHGAAARVLAGGTDLLAQMKGGVRRPAVIVDVKRIPELMELRETNGGLAIGAAVPAVELREHPLLRAHYPGLAEAVALIGSEQIQGRASLGGNLCNASPAADLAPPLLWPAAASATSPSIDVRMEIRAPKGRLLGVEFADLATTLAVARGSITLEPLSVGLFDGTLAGRLVVDTTRGPADMTVSAQVDAIDVAKATTFAGSPGVMTGRLGGTIDVRAAAGAPDVVFRTATGRATLAVADGTFPGLDLIGPVILAFGKPDTAKTVERSSAFATLGGTFALSRGVLQSDDFSMASRDLDLKGREMRVAGSVVDVKADLLLSEALSSQAGSDLRKYAHEGSRVVVPATITGDPASPRVSIDLGAAVGRGIKNAAEDELKKGLGRLRKR